VLTQITRNNFFSIKGKVQKICFVLAQITINKEKGGGLGLVLQVYQDPSLPEEGRHQVLQQATQHS
jgi:hypothetical protein